MCNVISVSEIVEKLCNDEVFVRNSVQFFEALDIPAIDRVQSENLFTMGVAPGSDHFAKLLKVWSQQTVRTLGHLRQTLSKTCFIAAAESISFLGGDDTIIRCSRSVTPVTTAPLCYGAHPPNPCFVGRKSELEQLSTVFDSRRLPQIVNISGIGGQGKTELCRRFIKELQSRDDQPSTIWLNGDSAASLISSVTQLAEYLGLSIVNVHKSVPFNQLIHQVADKILKSSKLYGCVIVIDNVDTRYEEFVQTTHILRQYSAFVIVTSRKIDVFSGSATQIVLDVLKKKDAKKLVHLCLRQPQTHVDILNLCQELANHALALRQAVAYINAQQHENYSGYGIKEYIQELLNDRKLLQNPNSIDGYDHNFFLIIKKTITTIQRNHGRPGRRAVELMGVICLLRPDGISVSCFQKFYETTQLCFQNLRRRFVDVDIHEALLVLKKYSLIAYDRTIIPQLSIHRIVQTVAQSFFSKLSTKWIIRRFNIFECSKDELRHFIHICNYADPKFILKRGEFLFEVFNKLQLFKLFKEMPGFAENCYAILHRSFGPFHESTLRMLGCVGHAISLSGHTETALIKFIELREGAIRSLGEDHTVTLAAAINIAMALKTLNRFDESLEWYEQALECHRRVLGRPHPDLWDVLEGMSVVLVSLKRINESLKIAKELLNLKRKALGCRHPSSLCTRFQIASLTICKFGADDATKQQLEWAILEMERIAQLANWKNEDRHTMALKAGMSPVMFLLGRYEEGHMMMQKTLAIQEGLFGQQHPICLELRKCEGLILNTFAEDF